jgi:beta-barrel assembly-enhancing protease
VNETLKTWKKLTMRFAWIVLVLAGMANGVYARVELEPCRNRYSPDTQIELGRQSKLQVYQQMPVLPDGSPVTQYIQQLGNKLTKYAPGYQWPYNFHVADVAEINAFALPGGTIFVNLGTIQAAETEAQLAGVMAHEISHVVLQHSACNEEKQQRVGLLAGIGEIAASVALSGIAGQVAEQGIQETTSLGFLRMSRGAEKQADLEGVGILYDAGYDPRGMPQFFAIIEAKYGEGGAQFLSDHPNPGNRMEYVDKEIASFPRHTNYVTTSPEFAHIQQLASGIHAYTASEISSGVWKHQGLPRTDHTGVHQHSAATRESPDLSAPTKWRDFHVNGFSLQIPANWRVYHKPPEALAGPHGGIIRASDGSAGTVTYGMLTDVYHPEGGQQDSTVLGSLIHEITQNNPNIKAGQQRELQINGVTAQTVECTNPSGSNGLREHYWITAFPQGNGSWRYFAFVAPAEQFKLLRPTFHKLLHSVTRQS